MLKNENKKVTILLRGQHYQDKKTPFTTGKWNGSFFDIQKNFQKMILNPLKKYNPKIYISTWQSPIAHKLKKYSFNIKIHELKYFDKTGYKQANIILNGLNLIPNNQNDLILILRFDLLWKKPITEWFPFKKNFDICFPWKGHDGQPDPKLLWDCCEQTGDYFWGIQNKNNNLKRFKIAIKNSLEDQLKRGYPYNNLHEIYSFLKDLKCIFAIKGFYPSTSCSRYSTNPIFINYNRPYHFKDININELIDKNIKLF